MSVSFQAGFSELKLKVPAGLPLASGTHFAETGGDDLYARAMVVRSGDYAVALLNCDLLGVPGRLVSDVRRIVHQASKGRIEELAIMITATGNLSGPAVPKLFPSFPLWNTPALSAKYENENLSKMLSEQLAAGILNAWTSREPATFKVGAAPLPSDLFSTQRAWDNPAGIPDASVATFEVVTDDGTAGLIYNLGVQPQLGPPPE